MEAEEYFKTLDIVNKKRYDALRSFFVEKHTAEEVCIIYGYTVSSFYSLVRDFRNYLKSGCTEDFFFKETQSGRKKYREDTLFEMIVSLRKQNFSMEHIVGIVNSKGYDISYGYVYKMLKDEGFARLPRRSAADKKSLELPPLKASIACRWKLVDEKFHSQNTGQQN